MAMTLYANIISPVVTLSNDCSSVIPDYFLAFHLVFTPIKYLEQKCNTLTLGRVIIIS